MPMEHIDLLRKDHTALAASVSVLTTEIGSLKTEKAVDAERDRNLRERLDRIEKNIEGLYGLGKWMLIAFGTSLMAAIVTFIVKGGLSVPPSP